MAWYSDINWGRSLQGAGALAGAWGSYSIGKEANKIAKANLNYEKSKDKIVSQRQAQAQSELDDALYNVYGAKKKKAKKVAGDVTDAFVSPSDVSV